MPTQPDPTPLPVRLARAVLLFHRGGEWKEADAAEWLRLTNTPLATTKTLCDMARLVEQSAGDLMAVARRQALLEAEAVVQRMGASDAWIGAIVALREASHGNG